MIKLFEYEGKAILARCGIPVPPGALYRDLPDSLDGRLVVKAQVLAGRRGQAGGIRFAKDRGEALQLATTLAGTTIGDEAVADVYIEEHLDIVQEFYLAAVVDRDLGMPVLLACSEGGVDIESIPAERILRQRVDPLIGLQPFMVARIVRGMSLQGDQAIVFGRMIEYLYAALVSQDAELIEINPLVLTADGQFLAADAKVVLDEDAAFRHSNRRAEPAGTSFERKSRQLGVIGVETAAHGGVAAIMNGAGLTMATLDEIVALGGIMSGVVELHGATAQGPERIADVIELVMQELDPAVVLINVHFQFRSLETIAQGIARAFERMPQLSPARLVVRLRGEKEAEARAILSACGCPMLHDFSEACVEATARAAR
jgi:succinyl-CoA synthetase beta subunit